MRNAESIPGSPVRQQPSEWPNAFEWLDPSREALVNLGGRLLEIAVPDCLVRPRARGDSLKGARLFRKDHLPEGVSAALEAVI